MARSRVKKQRDPLPEQFNSLDDAVEFWDTHSIADYEEAWKDVQCEIDIKRRTYQISVDSSLYQKLRHAARERAYRPRRW
ncbi:MAG: CopG family antitoxin [Acidobacteriota bacterium]